MIKRNSNFNKNSCRFESDDDLTNLKAPLSVILQITRRCNLSCIFCSETERMPDPSIDDLIQMKNNLIGTKRIYLSGGEPLLRSDLKEIIDIFYKDFIIGLPTNAIKLTNRMAKTIKEKIDFVIIGLDGPRNVTNKIRGDYDKILKGINILKKHDVPLALCSVVLPSTKNSILYACQIADTLEAKKFKLILPVPKGNALNLGEEEYLTTEETNKLFDKIKKVKLEFGWRPKITLTTWGPEVEGYSILVYPNGNTYAWPVYDQKNKVLLLGNILSESIEAIWEKYPFKQNHINKYLGKSIKIA